jgi:fido (protein-threonine AMPylation protein)
MLFTRATAEWINRVNQKHKQLTELQLSAAQQERLNRRVETEFVYSTLKLEGDDKDDKEDISEDVIARLVSAPEGDETAESNKAAKALLWSLRYVTDLARSKGKDSELSTDILLRLHNVERSASGFREGPGDNPARRLARPEVLPAMIDNACQWYRAESFTELNPVEQASIVLLRLLELQPFGQQNGRTALVASSLFTLRRELPPIIIRPKRRAEYQSAIEEGYRMNTKPMVELIAEALERSLTNAIEETARR